jgi:hypothetical protein
VISDWLEKVEGRRQRAEGRRGKNPKSFHPKSKIGEQGRIIITELLNS